jgi:hypothetical protein
MALVQAGMGAPTEFVDDGAPAIHSTGSPASDVPAATAASAIPAASSAGAQSAPVASAAAAPAATHSDAPLSPAAHFSDAPSFAGYTAPLVAMPSTPAVLDLAGAAAPAMMTVSSVFSSNSGSDVGFAHAPTFELPFTTEVASGDPVDYSISGDSAWVLVSSYDLFGDWFIV